MDPTVADRVVVVSALGGAASGGSVMGWPNGELDAWADWIVGQRFRYIQVNGYYDQLGDVTAAKVADLPGQSPSARGWPRRLPTVFQIAMSSDQIGVLAVGVPTFVTAVGRAVVDTSAAFDATTGPPLAGAGGRLGLGRAQLRQRDGGGPALEDAAGSAHVRRMTNHLLIRAGALRPMKPMTATLGKTSRKPIGVAAVFAAMATASSVAAVRAAIRPAAAAGAVPVGAGHQRSGSCCCSSSACAGGGAE